MKRQEENLCNTWWRTLLLLSVSDGSSEIMVKESALCALILVCPSPASLYFLWLCLPFILMPLPIKSGGNTFKHLDLLPLLWPPGEPPAFQMDRLEGLPLQRQENLHASLLISPIPSPPASPQMEESQLPPPAPQQDWL